MDECGPLGGGGVLADRVRQPLLPPQLRRPGEAVQSEPMKPKLKAPGTKRLKLKYENMLSRFAFKCNLRRHVWGSWSAQRAGAAEARDGTATLSALAPVEAAGAHTRPLLTST
jgi:hypothetical protein